MSKLCNACGEEPRMVSSTGKELTMCQGCQRDYWSNKQAARLEQQPRVCKQCQTEQPFSAFIKKGRVCNACKEARDAVVPEPAAPKSPRKVGRGTSPFIKQLPGNAEPRVMRGSVLLVDRNSGQVILCEIVSEIPADARQTDHLMAFYAGRGVRVVDAVERVPEQA
jgi:hypothetical protein